MQNVLIYKIYSPGSMPRTLLGGSHRCHLFHPWWVCTPELSIPKKLWHFWVLNYICWGLKKVLKSITFYFWNGARTLTYTSLTPINTHLCQTHTHTHTQGKQGVPITGVQTHQGWKRWQRCEPPRRVRGMLPEGIYFIYKNILHILKFSASIWCTLTTKWWG